MPPPSDHREGPPALGTLVDLAYAAAAEPSEWPSFQRGLATATHSDVVPFLVWDYGRRNGQCLRLYPLDETTMREYLMWAPHNPYVRQSPRLRTGQVRIIRPSDPDIRRSAFYNEWLYPRLKVGHNLAVTVLSDPALSVQLLPLRDPAKPPYGPREATLLRALGPHVRRAITIEQKLTRLEADRGGLSAALDRSATATFLLDGRGTVVFFNQAARELLDRADGLALDGRSFLVPSRPAERMRLQSVVADACATGLGQGTGAGGALCVSRASGARGYQLVVAPLRHGTAATAPFAPCAVVFAADPDHVPSDVEATLCELFRLTPAEARIARLLAEGHRVAEISDMLSLRKTTIRTHLKRLLEKTDSRTQSDLMRILSAIPTRSLAP